MGAVDADIKALRGELKDLRKDFARLADTLERTARHGSEELFREARHSTEGLREGAAKAAHAVLEEIENKPVASTLSIFAVGVMLGLLFSGRR